MTRGKLLWFLRRTPPNKATIQALFTVFFFFFRGYKSLTHSQLPPRTAGYILKSGCDTYEPLLVYLLYSGGAGADSHIFRLIASCFVSFLTSFRLPFYIFPLPIQYACSIGAGTRHPTHHGVMVTSISLFFFFFFVHRICFCLLIGLVYIKFLLFCSFPFSFWFSVFFFYAGSAGTGPPPWGDGDDVPRGDPLHHRLLRGRDAVLHSGAQAGKRGVRPQHVQLP